MDKKAQVTIFIIIGIILLIIIGLFVYLKQSAIFQDIFIPKEIIPLTVYAQECINNAAEEAVFLSSLQGGYVQLPQKILKDPQSTINNGFKVPYWYYQGEDRSPSMTMFLFSLESYINEKALGCINNFEVFKEQYNISAIEQITTKVTLADTEMLIETVIATKVQPYNKQSEIQFPKLTVHHPTKIKKLFLLAKEIMLKENTNYFLEVLTDDMIASSDYLPYAGVELSCNERSWSVTGITLYIKNMIMHNFKFLTFEKTFYQNTGYEYYEKQYRIPLKGNNYGDLQVNTLYNPAWPLSLQVSPSRNGIVKPLEFTMSNFVFACFKLYNHKYSVEYPVLFQIIDKDNPNNVFYFATPVLLKRNEPNRYNEVPLWPTELDVVHSKDYCEGNETVSRIIIGKNNEIATKTVAQQKATNKLTVYAYDESLQLPQGLLNNVTISYQCIRFKCTIGTTAYPKDALNPEAVFTGIQPYLEALYPDCENGIIIAEKQGYLSARLHQTVSEETNGFTVNVPMTKLKRFNLRVHVFDDGLSENGEHTQLEQTVERDLLASESVLITLKNKEKSYDKTLYFPADENTLELMLNTVPYEVEIKLIEDEQIVGTATYSWSAAFDQLQLRNGILFFVPKIKQTSPNLVNQYQQLQDAEKKYKDVIEPRLTWS